MILRNPVSPAEEMLGFGAAIFVILLVAALFIGAIFLIIRAAKKKTFYPGGSKPVEHNEKQEDTTHAAL